MRTKLVSSELPGLRLAPCVSELLMHVVGSHMNTKRQRLIKSSSWEDNVSLSVFSQSLPTGVIFLYVYAPKEGSFRDYI